jgi:UDP-N-acetylglucosamine--N-acetylmuramyl-(pentapeptide) pyrophosphoryl-undecaprenol N-acetylglucosamine transferase
MPPQSLILRTSSSPTLLFAGGGTGGHLYPGVAVAERLRAILPGARPLFLCTTRGIDKTILEPTGFEFIPQPILPPDRSISGLLKFWKSWRDTKELVARLLRERAPALVLGLGGYAAGVAVKLAGGRKIPAALINPDVIPGKANQYLMRYVSQIYCQFEQTRHYVAPGHREKITVTGCPIRGDLRQLPPRHEAMDRLGLDPVLQTLVVTGASQGARTVNEAVLELFKTFKPQGWQVLHLSGRDHAEGVRAAYRELSITARVMDFTAAMADVWAVADLAVSRSGASSCAELTACGVPSVLMPYPFHKDKHQRLNAEVLHAAGAAILVDDERDARKNAEKLRPIMQSLLLDSNRRLTMAAAARSLGRTDAADAVAQAVSAMVSASSFDLEPRSKAE